jgi:drug/metabolite transporter (DMT)-like permease
MKKKFIRGMIIVALGAASYGVLATMVKLAYQENYSLAEVVFSQYAIGLAFLGVFGFFQRKSKLENFPKTNIQKKAYRQMVLAGTSMGFTGIFYYEAIQFLPVAICIVLLMQSIWMGVILDAFLLRKFPDWKMLICVFIVFLGTVLSTQFWSNRQHISIEGVVWGLMAAASYTFTIFAGNKLGIGLSAIKRSFWMMLGGFIVICGFLFIVYSGTFNWSIFWKWGILLALFGTIVPPLLFNYGLPITGIGIGSILASMEIPVSIITAHFILHEPIDAIQWLGVVLIITAIALMNLRGKQKGGPIESPFQKNKNTLI